MNDAVDSNNADNGPSAPEQSDGAAGNRKWYQKKKWQIGGGLLVVAIIWSSATQESDPESTSSEEEAAEVENVEPVSEDEDEDEPVEVENVEPVSEDVDEDDESEIVTPDLPAAYDYELVSNRDVSFAGVTRLSVAIEIAEFPIERERLDSTLAEVVESLRGEAHAISVQVHYDRRESTPGAYGVYSWAPGGIWSDADQGDTSDWDGYEFGADSEPGKIDNPGECSAPTEDELEAIGAFWDRRATHSDEAEPDSMAVAAEQVGMSAEDLKSTVSAGLGWNYC